MNKANSILPSLALLAVLLLLSACVSRPTPEPNPTGVAVPPSLAAPSPTSPGPSSPASSGAPLTSSAGMSSTPELVSSAKATATPQPASWVEDCMAGCHEPDPDEVFGVGVVSQPADHVGRTTCLECHATQTNPALPATHAGRMDPACPLCHLPPGVPTKAPPPPR